MALKVTQARLEKIQNLNTDLKLLREFSKPSLQQRICGPNNLSQLAKLLRKKNSRFQQSKDSRERGQDWLEKKGADIKPLINKIRALREDNAHNNSQKKIEQDCYFYMPEVTLSNHEEYLTKSIEYSTFTLVQSCMSSRSIRRHFTRKVLGRFRNNAHDLREARSANILRDQVRSPDKKNIYVKVIKSLLDNGVNVRECVHSFADAINTQFWNVIYGQLAAVPLGEINSAKQLLMASLRMVEADFNSSLPSSNEAIKYYLTTNYLEKLEPTEPYVRDAHNGAFWAKAFLLYRAGRKLNFYELLTEHNQRVLLKEFYHTDQAIKQGEPMVSNFRMDFPVEDVFLDQLIYALRGEPKYSCNALSDLNGPDIAWILLRNVGIFRSDKERFLELRSQLIKEYKTQYLNSTRILNMFYLLAYKDLLMMGINALLDQDDYLHLLIAVVYNPVLVSEEDELYLRKKLTTELADYIYELLTQNRQEYIYYMLLMPEEHMVSELSSIISSSELVKKVDWRFLKNHIRSQLFEDLVKETLTKFVSISKDYLIVAQKYCEILQDYKLAIDLLLQMLLKSVNKIRFSDKQLDAAEKTALNWLNKDPEIQKTHAHIFNFLIQNRKLEKLIKSYSDEKISEEIKTSDYIITDGRIHYSLSRVFEQLIRHDCFDVYFVYLKNVVRGAEMALVKKGLHRSLKEFQQFLLDSLLELLELDPYSQYSTKEAVADLISILREAVWVIE